MIRTCFETPSAIDAFRHQWQQSHHVRICDALEIETANALHDAAVHLQYQSYKMSTKTHEAQYWQHTIHRQWDPFFSLTPLWTWLNESGLDWVDLITGCACAAPAPGSLAIRKFQPLGFDRRTFDPTSPDRIGFYLNLWSNSNEALSSQESLRLSTQAGQHHLSTTPQFNAIDLFQFSASQDTFALEASANMVDRYDVLGWFFPIAM